MSTVHIQTPDVLFEVEADDDAEAAEVIKEFAVALHLALHGAGFVVFDDTDGLPLIIRADQILSIYVAAEDDEDYEEAA